MRSRVTGGRPSLMVDLALGLAAGLAGYAVNRWPVPLGAGVEFFVGSFFAFLVLPRSTLAATLGGVLAAGHLLIVWDNPVAWAISAIEVPVVALLGRWRRIDPVAADALFWAAFGIPAGYLAHHAISGFQSVTAALAAVQQGLGGFFSVGLACVAGLLLQAVRGRTAAVAPTPLRAVVTAIVSLAAIATGILIVAVDARLYWRTLVEERAEEIFRVRDLAIGELARLRDEATLLVVALTGTPPGERPKADLSGEASRLLGMIEVPADGGGTPWLWRRDDAPPAPDPGGRPAEALPAIELTVPIEGAPSSRRAKATLRPEAVAERLARVTGKDAEVVLRDDAGTVRVDPSGLASRLPRLDWHCMQLRPSGSAEPEMPDLRPLVAPILVWTTPLFCTEAQVPAFPGMRLIATMSVVDVSRRHHRALLDTMLLVVAICGLGVLSAAALSHAVGRRIGQIREALAAGPSFRFASRPESESAIAELRLLEQDIARLSEALGREAAEATLMRRRLETIAEHTPIIVYILDLADGAAPSFVTKSVERILGYTPTEALTWDWWSRSLHPEDAPAVIAELRQVAETGGFTAEFRLKGKDGAYRWLYDELRVIADPDGRPREAVGVMIDVTKRKQSETRLIETANLVSLGEMSAGVAHELTQPLHVIGLAAENLMEQVATTAVVSERALIKLRDIVEQTHRAAGIVHRMRQLGRRDGSPPARIRVGEAIENALRPLHGELKAFGITLDLGGDGLGCHVLGQPGHLEQVMINLVTNARDSIYQRHSEVRPPSEGGDRIEVLVRERPTERRVSIRVRDTGTGLDPTILKRAFEPFFTTKEVGKGLGLGLAIVHGTVRDLGGIIEARNWEHGAEFEVLLPQVSEPTAARGAA
ncbi:MAG: sensor histidine kinase [Alphaproteobacteria bacterium]